MVSSPTPDPASAPPPGARRPLRRAAFVAVGIGAVVGLYAVYWFVAAMQLRSGLESWATELRRDGFTVEYRGPALTGFPFAVRALLEAPAVAGPTGSRAWRWRAAAATVEIVPWNFSRLTARAPGRHEFHFKDQAREFAFDGTAVALSAALEFSAARLVHADVEGKGIAASGGTAAGARIERLSARFAVPQAPGSDHTAPTLGFNAVLESARLPDRIEAALGRDIAGLALKGQVLGAIGAGPPEKALAAWRDAGGTVKLDRVETAYGPLVVKGEGTLALDGAMQPIGAFTARITGLFDTVDRLRDQGLVRGRDAVTAKVVLGAFMRKDAGGPTLNIAVTVQDRKVFVGPVALIGLPELRW